MAMLTILRKGCKPYKVKDKGKRGRTPKKDRWFAPSVHSGWKAEQSPTYRRRLVLHAHKGDVLASGRSMLALSNVQKRINPAVSAKAKADSNYFFKRLKK